MIDKRVNSLADAGLLKRVVAPDTCAVSDEIRDAIQQPAGWIEPFPEEVGQAREIPLVP